MADRDQDFWDDDAPSQATGPARPSHFLELFGFGRDLFQSEAEVEEFVRGIYERRAESRRARGEGDA